MSPFTHQYNGGNKSVMRFNYSLHMQASQCLAHGKHSKHVNYYYDDGISVGYYGNKKESYQFYSTRRLEKDFIKMVSSELVLHKVWQLSSG